VQRNVPRVRQRIYSHTYTHIMLRIAQSHKHLKIEWPTETEFVQCRLHKVPREASAGVCARVF
jgi:hypothetical protein